MGWHDIRFITGNISAEFPAEVSQMGEVIQFIPKPVPDRVKDRLIQEARAIYESIFPTDAPANEQREGPKG